MAIPQIGRSVRRKEGRAKVTGQALYVDDISPAGVLHGVTVRSPIPRGRIRAIHFDPAIDWDDFIVVTAADIPGRNRVKLILDDQPYLASDVVNHPEEPVALIAHADRAKAEDARRHVTIDIDPLRPVFTIDESLAKTEIIWGGDNVFKSYTVEKGNVDASFDGALVVEGQYETGAQEQLYIEPNGMLALADRRSGVTVWGSMQCPYYIQTALAELFDVPAERIRVIQMATGGGFGGKEEYPSIVAGHAALLAWKAGRPVKLVYGRSEDMAATTKRHPSRTRHRTTVSRDGRLLAMEIEFVIDGGAYCTLSPVVLSRGTIHAAGPYSCPNVRVRGRAVATNAPPHGAFRGFGAPQSIFALERHMDKVAAAVGLAPEEFRRRNFVHAGDTLAVSQRIDEPVSMGALLDRALGLSQFREKRERFSRENASAAGQAERPTRARHPNGAESGGATASGRPGETAARTVSATLKGIGLASFMHGAGFTGSGEVHLSSVVTVEGTGDGVVRVLAASTEIGQGTNTIFSQIAADALGVDAEDIEVAQPDTAEVPNSGPTVASRTCMVVGKLVEDAALGLKHTLIDSGLLPAVYSRREFREALERYVERFGSLRASSHYRPPPGKAWDDEAYRGDAYGTYAWAVYVAEVSVDTVTYEVRVDDVVAVQEVGRVINPMLATGQIEGGVAQAIGWALYEDVVWREGRMANAQMTNYVIPTSLDVPPIRVYFEEVPYAYGPAGAKGIGELPMDGPAPAIANAVAQALGIDISTLPITPERLMEHMEAARV